MYEFKNRYHNIQHALFDGDGADGEFDIPRINPMNEYNHCDWIGFNYALSGNIEDLGIHFYIDDYQFEREWNSPDRYLDVLSKAKYVLTPDFSMFTDFPIAVNVFNHYRSMWMGRYWQMFGIKVIPTISWADDKSFEFCFDGVPTNSIVSVSSVGTQKNAKSKELFDVGFKTMMERVKPSGIIWHGKIPETIDTNGITIWDMDNFYNRFNKPM